MDRIPIYQPFIGEEERNNVLECIDSTWISSQGKFIEEFEERVQGYTSSKHAISVCNGTVAIHLALLALDLGPGDEVITTNFTYVASTNAILYVGAKPIFVDADALSWNINTARIEEKISPTTKAILYTNVYGTPAEYYKLKKLADQYNIYLIEDAAESFGATYDSMQSGTLGDISTFSFFGNKTITTGEGGMVLTSNDELNKKMRKLKNQGNSETIRYYHDILGYNYRMTNIQASIGLAQLGKLEQILKLKSKIQQNYEDGLSDFVTFQHVPNSAVSSYWMCSILFNSKLAKERAIHALESENIETRPFFTPIDKLPFYESSNDCPVSNDIYERGLNIPSYPSLREEEQEKIINTLRKINK